MKVALPPRQWWRAGVLLISRDVARDYGVRTGSITIDMERVRQRKRDIVNNFRNGNQTRIEKTPNLDLLFRRSQLHRTALHSSSPERWLATHAYRR